MSQAAIVFFTFLPAVAAISAAGALAMHGIDGWGWFLFIGFLCCGVKIRFKD